LPPDPETIESSDLKVLFIYLQTKVKKNYFMKGAYFLEARLNKNMVKILTSWNQFGGN
jgi:hypothetical protein